MVRTGKEHPFSAPGLLFLFFERLAVDAERGDGAGFQSGIGNLLFATLTDAIGVLIHSFKRLVDLLDQPLLSFTYTHEKILLGLRRRLIADIRECLLAVWIGEALYRFFQFGLALSFKITSNSCILFPLGRCFGFAFGGNRLRSWRSGQIALGGRNCFHITICLTGKTVRNEGNYNRGSAGGSMGHE